MPKVTVEASSGLKEGERGAVGSWEVKFMLLTEKLKKSVKSMTKDSQKELQ